MKEDLQHLKWLSIAHYILAGLTALMACLPLIHFFVGVGIMTGSFVGGNDSPPRFFGFLLVGMAVLLILMGWTLAILIARAGRKLEEHRSWLYCVVVASLECLCTPVGIVLCVLTLIVLMRPSVKALFEGQETLPSSHPIEPTDSLQTKDPLG